MNAATLTHESSHVACALLLHRQVDWVKREVGCTWADEVLGSALIPLVDGHFTTDDVVIRLVGYWSEHRWQGWPPDYRTARYESLEDLDIIIDALDLTAEQYEQLVAQARAMLGDPRFVRLRGALARLLAITPRLERGDIERLAAVHGVHVPDQPEGEQEPAPCSA